MVKICGVTYDYSPNYGSNLQAYALQTIITGMKIYGENCNYILIPVQKIMFHQRPIKTKIGYAVFYKPYRDFVKRHVHILDIASLDELEKLNIDNDAFVCGSDVIWNPDHNQNVGAYYLNFAEKYAFSYAASFGKENLDTEYLESLETRLSHLRRISVREPSAVKIIEKHTDYKCQAVLDPVLLLETRKWNEIAEPTGYSNNGYILVYLTHTYKTADLFIQQIREITNLKIVVIAAGAKTAVKYMAYPPSPEKWIGLIRDAKYVITNSFHCTAFCVMYHKTFFTVVQGELGKGIYVRMYDFLKELGLENRIYNHVPETIDLSAPSYDGVDEKLEIKRQESLAFLRENLEAAYREKMERENN